MFIVNMDPYLAPTRGLYWEFYTAAVAVTEMCAQHGVTGESRMLGKYSHAIFGKLLYINQR